MYDGIGQFFWQRNAYLIFSHVHLAYTGKPRFTTVSTYDNFVDTTHIPYIVKKQNHIHPTIFDS